MTKTLDHKPRKNQKPRRTKKPEMTAAQKRQLIDRHVERVQKADAGTTAATWKLADELAELVDAYKLCHKFPPSASKLEEITNIGRDGTRMQLLAKLAKFFPQQLRQPPVGVRVYAKAYQMNRSLKAEGRKMFTAEELVGHMKGATSAIVVKDFVTWAARGRDRPADTEEVIEVRDHIVANTPNYKLTAKKWFKTYDMSPAFAIAAAVKLLPDTCSINRINTALARLDLDYRIMKPESPRSTNIQVEPFDDEDGESTPNEAAAV